MFLSIFVRNTLKLVGKLVVAGGAVAFTYRQGLWGLPDDNRKSLVALREVSQPLLPFEIPSSEALKLSWNDGVHTFFDTVENSPALLHESGVSLVEKVKDLMN